MKNSKEFIQILDKLIVNTQHTTILELTRQRDKSEKEIEVLKHQTKSFESLNTSLAKYIEEKNNTIKELKLENKTLQDSNRLSKISKNLVEKLLDKNDNLTNKNKELKTENSDLKRKLRKLERRKTKPKRVYSPIKPIEEDQEWLNNLLNEYSNGEEFNLDNLSTFDELEEINLDNLSTIGLIGDLDLSNHGTIL